MNRSSPLVAAALALVAWQSLAAAQCRVARLVGKDIHREDWYGLAIGVSGDVAMVGAPANYSSPNGSRVFVFNRTSTSRWELVQTIDDQLGIGRPLAVAGDIAVFGEYPGVVYERGSVGWTRIGPLVSSAGVIDFGIDCGQAIAIEGTRIVAGTSQTRRAYVFERDAGGVWTEVGVLSPSQGGWLFGYAVAVRGDVIVVGAPNDMSQTSYAGAAFVFERQLDGAWTQTARLLASDPRSLAAFGSAVAIEAGSVLIGAPGAGTGRAGQVYVFQRLGDGIWTETLILRGDPSPHRIEFGGWMSAEGGVLAVGAMLDGGLEPPNPGAVYVFESAGSGWLRRAKLIPPPEANPDGRFGARVALSKGDTVLFSGALRNSFYGTQSGEVYVYPVGADSDGDGTMDVCECWSAGDLDLSSAIGLADLVLLLSSFGVDASGDVDMDGVTGLHDLVILLSHFGEACP